MVRSRSVLYRQYFPGTNRPPDHSRRLRLRCWLHSHQLYHTGQLLYGRQLSGAADFISIYQNDGDLYGAIIAIIRTLPCAPLVLVLLLVTMIAFYATSFDSIALIGSCYSYHRLGENEMPHGWYS